MVWMLQNVFVSLGITEIETCVPKGECTILLLDSDYSCSSKQYPKRRWRYVHAWKNRNKKRCDWHSNNGCAHFCPSLSGRLSFHFHCQVIRRSSNKQLVSVGKLVKIHLGISITDEPRVHGPMPQLQAHVITRTRPQRRTGDGQRFGCDAHRRQVVVAFSRRRRRPVTESADENFSRVHRLFPR